MSVGNAGGGALTVDFWPAVQRNQTVIGVFMGTVLSRAAVRQTIDMMLADVAKGSLTVPIDRRFPLAEAGAEVVIVDIDGAGAASAAAALEAGGHAIHHRSADLSNADTVEALAEEICRTIGVIDILVNNAGIVIVTDPLETSEDDWKRTMSVNTDAVYYCAKAFGRRMKEKGSGSIVNIGSVNAYVGAPKLGPYSVSKGGLMTLTRNAASALNRYRIRVNQLNVGWTLTEGEDAVQKKQGTRADWLADAVGMMPFRRLLTPREIAYAAAYFASDESALITGGVLDMEQMPIGAPADW